MRKRWLYLILPLITLLLELLPYGAVCNFANPEGDPWRRTFSYFDPTPFGYANFAPLLTAVTTCVILVLLSVYLFAVDGKKKLLTAIKWLLCIGIVLSLCPLLFGYRFFSIVGMLITISLVGELVLLHLTSRANTTK